MSYALDQMKSDEERLKLYELICKIQSGVEIKWCGRTLTGDVAVRLYDASRYFFSVYALEADELLDTQWQTDDYTILPDE